MKWRGVGPAVPLFVRHVMARQTSESGQNGNIFAKLFTDP